MPHSPSTPIVRIDIEGDIDLRSTTNTEDTPSSEGAAPSASPDTLDVLVQHFEEQKREIAEKVFGEITPTLLAQYEERLRNTLPELLNNRSRRHSAPNPDSDQPGSPSFFPKPGIAIPTEGQPYNHISPLNLQRSQSDCFSSPNPSPLWKIPQYVFSYLQYLIENCKSRRHNLSPRMVYSFMSSLNQSAEPSNISRHNSFAPRKSG